MIIRAVDVTFDLVWRHDGTDTLLATTLQHFEPLPNGEFKAIPCDLDMVTTQAIEHADGDQFIFRYSGANTTSSQAYIPNGDGATTGGRIPNITLPK